MKKPTSELGDRIAKDGKKIGHNTLNPYKPTPYYQYESCIYEINSWQYPNNMGDSTEFISNVKQGKIRFVHLY